jgi:catechol 2,3-dioxygenase-like lactoylglutathione lyase family enzyme
MITEAVHHVSFAVDDLDASLHFYQELLGLQPVARPEMGIGGAWLAAGSTQIHLIVCPEGVDVGSPPPKTLPLANHTAFAIDDYLSVRDQLVAGGLEVVETSPERGQMWVSDPSGNVIEFIAEPA